MYHAVSRVVKPELSPRRQPAGLERFRWHRIVSLYGNMDPC